jgi:lipopolysaccharide heptosyltransferase II
MQNPVTTFGKAIFYSKKKELPKKIDRILFIKTGALGDVIMTTPLVRAVRNRFPKAVIDYACGSSFADVLEGNININYIIRFNEEIFYKKNYRELRKLARKLRENNYDIIFVLDKHWGAGVFAALAGDFRIGFDRYGEGFANNLNIIYKQKEHDILAYLDLGIYARAGHDSFKTDIFISPINRSFAKKICKKNSIVIAPGGGVNKGQHTRIKLWPKERYLKLVDELSKKYHIILVGGKHDMLICAWICKNSKNRSRIRNMCGKTTIKQAAAIIEKSKFVVCNDSGVMHIASCVNDKIISLFGPTDPRVLAPLSPNSTFIWKEKQPCYDINGNFSRCANNIMKSIAVEDVINAAREIRKQRNRH